MPLSLTFLSDTPPYPLLDESQELLDIPVPLRPQAWEYWLARHPDRIYADTIIQIILRGVKIGFEGASQLRILPAHPTAGEAPEILSADVEKQLANHRLITLASIPQSHYIASPLGLVPKHDGGWRRIHDLSFPRGKSVNDGIKAEFGALEYTSFEEALAAVIKQGPGAVLVKKDLSDAFRHIPVAPSDQWLLGFEWQGIHYMECFLPFGLRTAPFLFDFVAKGLHWILSAELGFDIILHYLDDFFGVFPPGFDPSTFSRAFDGICEELGLRVNVKKDILGCIAEFLGIEIDTLRMIARLPADKLERALQGIAQALNSDGVKFRQLESLVGLLSFATRVIPLGRPFLSRLYEALAKKTTWIHLKCELRNDLIFWSTLLKSYNGVCLRRLGAQRRTFHVYTDACKHVGYGGYLLNQPGEAPTAAYTFACAYYKAMQGKDIVVKEMLAIVEVLRRYRTLLAGQRVVFHCDNQGVVGGLRNFTIHGTPLPELRQAALIICREDIQYETDWISTSDNFLADWLSRFHWEKIADSYPQLASLRASRPYPTR